MRLLGNFFQRDVLEVAPELLGKILVRRFDDGNEKRYLIMETEAYRGEEDLACHASNGKTERTRVLYEKGGVVYVYLIYGMYWMLNFIAGEFNNPQGVLIRGIKDENGNEITGSGRVGKTLNIDKSFYGERLEDSKRIWIEETEKVDFDIETFRRVGVDYAGEWAQKLWRFRLNDKIRTVN